MAQDSILWTTNGTGDGSSGGYTQAESIRWQRQAFIGSADQGILKNYDNELEVTAQGGSASPVTIDTGGAFVHGFPYWNTAAGTKNIPTPSSDPRVDIIALRADWSAQTVRFVRIAGTEGAGTPAITRTDGATWEIPLAYTRITTGGVVTVTDGRHFLRPNFEVYTGALQSDFEGKIDGDHLGVSWDPSNSTPDTSPSEADDADDLTAHLKGIDTELGNLDTQKVGTATFNDHSARHQNGGADEINVGGLSGDLADEQDPKAHASEHQNGGADEISVEGLSGDLADLQDPKDHANDHKRGGSDEVDGDQLDIDWNPTHSSPDTSPSEVGNADELTAHLKGVDVKLGQFMRKDLFPDLTSYAPLSGLDVAGYEVVESSTADAHPPIYPQLRFDPDTVEGRMFVFRWPDTYGSSPKLKGLYAMGSAHAAGSAVRLRGDLTGEGDGDSTGTSSFHTNAVDRTVPTSADEIDEFSMDLSDIGSIQSGDWVNLLFFRKADFAGRDTANNSDMKLRSLWLEWNGA